MSDAFDAALDQRASTDVPASSDSFDNALDQRAKSTTIPRPVMPDGRLMGETRKGAGDNDPSTAARDKQILRDRGDLGPDSPFGVVAGKLLSGTESAGRRVASGYRGLADIATGQGLGQATEDINRVGTTHPYQVDPRSGNVAAVAGEAMDSPFNPLNWVPKGAQLLGKGATAGLQAAGAGPELSQGVGQAIGEAGPWALGLAAPKGSPMAEAAPGEIRPGASALDHQQSISAARAGTDLSQASPELQQRVQEITAKGGKINPETLTRHVEAESLPVPIQLTRGQATQNVSLLSDELNARGKTPELAQRFNEQNGKLIENVRAVRDEVGPEVFSTDPTTHGDTLIHAYQELDAPRVADITAKYKALEDANGGQFPVDSGQLFANVSQALHKQLLFDHAPKSVMTTLGRLADSGNMTFEQFEALRTNLARVVRSSQDGNERAAAGAIRDAMEKLPLSAGAFRLKPLADSARAAARQRFELLRSDPAYKAAVEGTVPADNGKFVQKFVLSAPREQLAQMRQTFANNPTALQTMGVAAVDSLRNAAGVDAFGHGNFSQAGFNKALAQLSPKMQFLLDPKHINTLDQLGNVARYTQARPRGSYVNESNTFVAAAKQHAATALEGGINYAAKGVPIGTMGRNILKGRSKAKEVGTMLEPGAGISEP